MKKIFTDSQPTASYQPRASSPTSAAHRISTPKALRTRSPGLPRTRGYPGKAAPRGSIMVVTIGVIVVLASLALIYAEEMRIEAQAASNRVSALQSAGIARGAIAYANNHLLNNHDPVSLDSEMQCEAQVVGDGCFWILRPDPLDERNYAFGLVDEASKLNINTATFDMLMSLPNMTTDLASSIIDWRDADDTVNENGGAENEFYLGLPEPYYCKNDMFETLEELLLVKGSTTQLLYGVDANHNGVVDASEGSGSSSGTLSSLNGQTLCGIMKYLTVYSIDSNTSADGKPRLNVNQATNEELEKLLTPILGAAKVEQILPRLRRPYSSVFDFYVKSGMTIDDFKKLADRITISPAKTLPGLINIDTAPKEVLRCLPGMEDGDADALVSRRTSGGADLTSIAWVLDVLPQNKAVPIASYITVRSSRFSADIVAAAGSGRGFRRIKCVWDVRGASPALLYHKDLTSLGWPLDPAILDTLRNGQIPAATHSNSSSSSGGSNLPATGGLH